MSNQRAVAISKDCELGIAVQEAWIEPDVFQDVGSGGSLRVELMGLTGSLSCKVRPNIGLADKNVYTDY